jgi:hypothetical protein
MLAGLGMAGMAGAAENSPAAAAITGIISKLTAPDLGLVPASAPMAVSTSSEEAQKHVVAGLNLIHGGWDFEAYRHFCAALSADPDCLMAYWGITLAISEQDQEYGPQQAAAHQRMLALAEAGVGTELERGYVFCLNSVYTQGPAAAAEFFHKLAAKFPNEIQAHLLSAILGRGGFDEFGMATPDQLRSEKRLLTLLERRPEDTTVLYSFLSIHAEAADLTDSLPLARKLAALQADFPPYQHLLGHYEFRCGNPALAAQAFRRAIDGFGAALKSSGVGIYDCPNLLKARLYLAVALEAAGSTEEALAVAHDLAAIKIDPKRSFSTGATILHWEAETLPARILLGRPGKGPKPGAASLALAAMPPVAEVKALKDPPVAIIFYQALSIYLEGRVAIEAANLERAGLLAEALDQTNLRLAGAGELAAAQNARSYWIRAVKAMAVHAAELRGLLAIAGPESGRGSALNWYRSAIDKESRATLLMPPMATYPMALRLGDFHAGRIGRVAGELDRSVAAFQEGLKAQPNNLACLRGLQAALTTGGQPGLAAEVARTIEGLQGARN